MGWQQLKQILDEKHETKTTNCPSCDYPDLKENSKRQLLCPICGWRGNK